jgi:hypothetical protein
MRIVAVPVRIFPLDPLNTAKPTDLKTPPWLTTSESPKTGLLANGSDDVDTGLRLGDMVS